MGHARQGASASQGEASEEAKFDLGLLASRIMRKLILLFKPHGLWYFSMVVLANQYMCASFGFIKPSQLHESICFKSL